MHHKLTDVSLKSEKSERFSQFSVQRESRREESSPDRLFARMGSLLPSVVVPVKKEHTLNNFPQKSIQRVSFPTVRMSVSEIVYICG